MSLQHHVSTFIAVAALALAACGSDRAASSSAPSGAASSAEAARDGRPVLERLAGIYELTSATRNPDGCSAEGPSVLEEARERWLLVAPAEPSSGFVARVVSCRSVDDCHAKHADAAAGAQSYVWLEKAEGDTLRSTELALGVAEGGTCRGGHATHITLSSDGSGLEQESRRSRPVEHPAEQGDRCGMAALQKAAGTAPCQELAVVRGKRVADLR